MQGLAKYGKRLDGTNKGTGWFGELPMLDGTHGVMTEQSMTFDYGKGDVLVPLINPYSTRDELFHLSLGREPTKEIIDKARRWGLERLSKGQSPFITTQEQAVGLDRYYGNITNYDPSLKERIISYWHFTPPEEKFMDAISNGLSLAAGIGPAFKGLAAARHAIKPVTNVTKNFTSNLAKGLAREGAENVIADKVDSEILNHALAVEDAYQAAKLLRKF